MVPIMTTANHQIHSSKLKDRKKRNLMDSTEEQSQLVSTLSFKFTPPYSDKDAINEKIRMNNILGEHPSFVGKSLNIVASEKQDLTDNSRLTELLNLKTQKYVENLDDYDFGSNQSPLFKSTINYDDTLNNIFQKVKIKPLIQKISEYFIKQNSDLDLSDDDDDDDEELNKIDENMKTTITSDASCDFLTNNDLKQFPLSSSSQQTEFIESPPSESIQSSTSTTSSSSSSSSSAASTTSPESVKSKFEESNSELLKNQEKISSPMKFILDDDLDEDSEEEEKPIIEEEEVEEEKTPPPPPPVEETVSSNSKPLQVKDLNEELSTKSENEESSLDKKIDLDENGKPQLIVSIEFDLLKYCSGILSFDLSNGKKSLDLLKYKIENSENEQIIKQQPLPTKLNNNNNLKRSSPSIEGLSEINNNKKLKTSDEGGPSVFSNPKTKQNSTSNNTSKFSTTIQTNPTAIVKPMSIIKPPNQIKQINMKQKIGPNYEFLYNENNEEVFHNRGISKKHEADSEKESPIKKVTLYMEAVCNFCLCAITQHRFKKTKTAKSIELLNQTWKLLKHINDIAYKTKNNDFSKKFRILSNWLETFIFHWLWRLNLSESKKLSTSLNSLIHSLNTPNSNTTPNSIRNNSPSEMLQSPNSVCSAGSQNGHLVNNSNNSESSRSQSQPNELNLLRELHSKVKGYLAINDYNIRSQTKWDENEAAFQADKHLLDYREAIKTQVQFQLYINCEVEEFVSSVLSGLHLLQLNNS